MLDGKMWVLGGFDGNYLNDVWYSTDGTTWTQVTQALTGGSATVNNTSVTANTRVILTVQALGTVSVPKAVACTAISASTSFTITSADATDTSTVFWELREPA